MGFDNHGQTKARHRFTAIYFFIAAPGARQAHVSHHALWLAQFKKNIGQAKRYVRFCIKIYNHQRESGRYFSNEHPWLASSWFLPEMTKLQEEKGVQRIRTDMCQFGMMSRTAGVGGPLRRVLKPMGF